MIINFACTSVRMMITETGKYEAQTSEVVKTSEVNDKAKINVLRP